MPFSYAAREGYSRNYHKKVERNDSTAIVNKDAQMPLPMFSGKTQARSAPRSL